MSWLTGYIPDLPTPFDEDGEIDLKAFAKLCECQIAAGVSAIVVGETTGEASTLTPAEHCTLHDAATLAVLREGSKRAVVLVRAFQPTKPPAAGMVVSLLSANKAERLELTRFALHPPRPFTAQEPAKQRRFLSGLPSMPRASRMASRCAWKWDSTRAQAKSKAAWRKST